MRSHHMLNLRWLSPVEDMSFGEFSLRCIWIVFQILASYCLANQVTPFFYQQF